MKEIVPEPDRVWVGAHLARRFDLAAEVWITWCDRQMPAQQLEASPDGARCPSCTITAYGEIRAESIATARRALAVPHVQRPTLPPYPEVA